MATRNQPDTENTIRVTVGAIGSEEKAVILNGDRTVDAALSAAGFSTGLEVRIAGENYTGSDNVEDGDALIVINEEKVKGAVIA